MNRWIIGVIATMLVGLSRPAVAEEFVESYVAVLSAADHLNSSGERLKNVAAIIRQDRANFHKFNQRDEGDQSDEFFASAKNREVLERLLKGGTTTPDVREAIVNGTPTILVSLYKDESDGKYIDVVITQ